MTGPDEAVARLTRIARELHAFRLGEQSVRYEWEGMTQSYRQHTLRDASFILRQMADAHRAGLQAGRKAENEACARRVEEFVALRREVLNEYREEGDVERAEAMEEQIELLTLVAASIRARTGAEE